MIGFNERVWLLLSKIPRGRVATYRQIALAAGSPKGARAVGNACSKNPFAPKTPCHRVVSSDGSLGGYSGGVGKKIRLLEKEGVRVKNNKIVNFSEVLTEFKKLKK